MTNSPTNSIPNTTSRVNHFTGLARRRRKFSLLPANGDGSTLTLDFTTGVLDPRLTFTRGSNATFINSGGLVQYADANMVRNSVFSGSATPTGWTLVAGGAGATIPSDGVRRCVTTTAAQNFLNSAAFATSIGLVYATTVNIREVSGQHYRNAFEITASPTILKYYRNGVEVASGTGEFNTAQAGIITVVWIATSATAHLVRLGVGCTGANVANAVCEFERIHTTPVFFSGTTTATSPANYTAPAYVQNTDTSAAYHAPRFDHDPTTLAPRGLLIEGTASTLNQWGEDYTNAYWTKVGSSVSATSVAGPDNVSTATRRIVESATTAQHGIRRGIATTAGQAHTVSVFVKPGSYDSFGFELFWSASYNAKAEVTSISGNTQTVTSASGVNATLTRTVLAASGWYRYALTFTHPLAVGAATPDFNVLVKQTAAYAGNGTNYMDVYGFMLEAGSGASSYIPTGASTVQRLRDEVVLSSLPGIAFNQSAGTIYSQLEIVEKLRGSFVPYGSFDTSGGGRCWWWLRHNHDTSVGQRILGTAFNSGGSTAITSSNYTHSSGVFKFATSLDPVAGRMVYAIAGGSAQVTNASGFTLATAAQMSLNKNNDVAATDLGSMWVRSIKYWPTALPDATLQSLTT